MVQIYSALDNEDKRIGAIASKAIQALSEQADSVFLGRILLTDDVRTPLRCISLTSIFRALVQSGVFVVKKGVEYGPLWAGDNDKTLKRSIRVIKAWFEWLQAESDGWWELGADEGGGLAMNDGVTVCTGVLRSVFQHLSAKGLNLIQLSDGELVEALEPYGLALGAYFGRFSPAERQSFRSGSRGNQGQTASRRRCEKALHDKFPDFHPPGLTEHLSQQAAQTIDQAYTIYQGIEKTLQRMVIEPGFPFWPWHGESIPPRCPEYHVFSR